MDTVILTSGREYPIHDDLDQVRLRARTGRVVLMAVILSAAVGLFLGAALFPRVVEVPIEIEKLVPVRDDKAIADAKQNITVLKQTVRSLQGQVAVLQARQVRADAMPIEPIALAPSAKGLQTDALAILGEFGVTNVQVKECR